MAIPLPDLLRKLRAEEQHAGLQPKRWVWGMKLYMVLLRHPVLFHWLTKVGIAFMYRLGRKRGAFKSLLLANGWTKVRDFPAPQGNTFFAQRKRQGDNP